MKTIEIVPKNNNNYDNESYRNNITSNISLTEVEAAIKNSEYQKVSYKDFKLSIKVSSEEWEYINKYAEQENISMAIAVQWFWISGFKVLRNIHQFRKNTFFERVTTWTRHTQ